MSDFEITLAVLWGDSVSDSWSETALGRLAGVFAPLEVGGLVLLDAENAPLATWGSPIGGEEMSNTWSGAFNGTNLEVCWNEKGAFRFHGRFHCEGGVRVLDGGGRGLNDASAAIFESRLPAIAAAVNLLDAQFKQHGDLAEAEARIRQYRNEHHVLQQRQNELAASILAEQEARVAQERDLNLRLEAEVAARTEQLAQAKNRAERASKVRDALITNMGHELRTPLTAILGYTELLLDDPSDPHEMRQYLETIHSNAQHLLVLIEEVLALSQMEAGRLDFHRSGFAPHEVVIETVESFLPQLAARGLDLSVTFASPIPSSAFSDPDRVRQILRHLLDNAVKFTRVGGVRVVVGFDSTEGSRLWIEVIDTGPGIPADHLKEIFEPFHQVDSSTARPAGGAGLGLALARRMLNLMGGVLTVTSGLGKGSTFRMVLPVEDCGALHTPPDHHWPARPMQ